jgi:energy-coupling factor transporter transmembrane protein EcfT
MSHSVGVTPVSAEQQTIRLGPRGYLFVFFWILLSILIAPPARLPWVAALCMTIALAVFRVRFRDLLSWRRLAMVALLTIPPLLAPGETDRVFLGLPYSSHGLSVSLSMALKLLVILVLAEGLARTVSCAALAGMLERIGFHGLGFSVGVALNILPALQETSMNTWEALRMRGGFRRQWFVAARQFFVTVVSGALRRAEDIAVAAEARAFTPEHARPLPVAPGKFDWLALGAGLPLLLGVLML